MATRLQIARARARVALGRRTGESVGEDVVALFQIDLAEAEKPPRAWERTSASETSRTSSAAGTEVSNSLGRTPRS